VTNLLRIKNAAQKSIKRSAKALDDKFKAVVSQTRIVLERALAKKEAGEKFTGAATAEIQKQLAQVERVKQDLVQLQKSVKLVKSAGEPMASVERRCKA